MFCSGKNISYTCVLITVLASWISTINADAGDKTLNLKIGFDLTQGDNGAPNLHIRNFDDSEDFSPRAVDNDEKNDKEDTKASPAVRADSDSSGDTPDGKNRDDSSSRESDAKQGKGSDQASDDDDDSSAMEESEAKLNRITKGLVDDVTPKSHGRIKDDSDDG